MAGGACPQPEPAGVQRDERIVRRQSALIGIDRVADVRGSVHGERIVDPGSQGGSLRPGLRPGGVAAFGGSAADVLT